MLPTYDTHLCTHHNTKNMVARDNCGRWYLVSVHNLNTMSYYHEICTNACLLLECVGITVSPDDGGQMMNGIVTIVLLWEV